MAVRQRLNLPSIEYLHQRLWLDAEQGRLYWKDYPPHGRLWNSNWAGKPALESIHHGGYKGGNIDGRYYLAHVVIFAMANGYWPDEVDHRDLDQVNNRPDNLRASTRSQNMLNRRKFSGKSSQYKGVSWHKKTNRWRVRAANHSGYTEIIGYFDDEVEAAEAYDTFVRREHGEFCRTNFTPDMEPTL